ncbi:A24 family peptidase [Boseongicola sp. H5]|uniref:prepilin peptidase n=1 Tax=Rhodobacterales TaxID=204455 RepID=UPI001B01DBCC|nr:A24 family peptidase [Boseongicola sp. H5]MBO6603901.1 prepilin peptidase [Roseicyclus sp.]MBO6624861.1 prepilin peptidase [Roseicyclus sp.]MBO6924192.1 prepilin peptidase [Roseicyclus sp.]
MNLPLNLALHITVYGAVFMHSPLPGPDWPWAFALGALLVWASLWDFARFEIPDLSTLLLVSLGGLRLMLVPNLPVLDHVLGAVIWPILFGLVGYGFLRLRGRQGLGFGDVKLMSGLGLWLGFSGTIPMLLGAAVAAIATLLVFRIAEADHSDTLGTSAIAFGPFLCLSTWVVWLHWGTT